MYIHAKPVIVEGHQFEIVSEFTYLVQILQLMPEKFQEGS